MSRSTRIVVLNSYANGVPITEANFSIKTKTLPELKDGQLLLQTLELSPEPYMRGRMTGVATLASYLPPYPLGEAIQSFGVARVIASKNPKYEVGQVVYGVIEWGEESVWDVDTDKSGLSVVVGGDGTGLRPISPHAKPYGRALDVIGIVGLTAYFSSTEFAKPQPWETVLISSAAGAVGAISAQICKFRGARVIGLAGSDEKCRVLTQKLKLDAALNYKSKTLEKDLRDLMPKGPDVYMDHVGGDLSQMIMHQMFYPARVVEIGQISTYDEEGGGWKMNLRPVHDNCLQFTGFQPMIFLDYFPGALAQMGNWLDTGKLIALETVHNGLENASKAFAGLFRGENIGKMRVHIAD